jgi:type I restriction enzyme M protein
MAKPKSPPAEPFPTDPAGLHLQGEWLWIPLRGEWRNVSAKPEELVRQHFIRHLCENYGYTLEQMKQEQRMTSGSRSARADIVIWESADTMARNQTPVLVVECKAESVEINLRDYYQGESYTRSAGCEFFIGTNNRFTAVFKLVAGAPGDFVQLTRSRELPIGETQNVSRTSAVSSANSTKENLRIFF